MVSTLTSTILLIEDEYNLRQSLQLIFQHAGYLVKTLQVCPDVSETPVETACRLVILSLYKSGHCEIEQIAKVRSCFPNTPILVLAASETRSLEQASKGKDVFYLAKPVDPKEILASINDILNGHR